MSLGSFSILHHHQPQCTTIGPCMSLPPTGPIARPRCNDAPTPARASPPSTGLGVAAPTPLYITRTRLSGVWGHKPSLELCLDIPGEAFQLVIENVLSTQRA